MSDVNKAGEELKEQEAKIKETVSKEYQEKLTAKDSEVKRLQDELDNAKLSLLDPKYISFLESERGSKQVIREVSKEVAEGDLSVAKIAELEQRLARTNTTLEQLVAVMEVKEVEAKYPDFNKFREDTTKVLETSNTSLTIEQAYKIAKQNVKDTKTDKEKEMDAKSGAEKPGTGGPREEEPPKSFKDKKLAGEDAWDKVMGSGKDSI
jgi:hypothetical protein